MKSIDGRGCTVVSASLVQCFALVAAVDRYPEWNGEIIRGVEVLASDQAGRPVEVRMRIHVSQSPIGKNFEFVAAVRAEPMQTVSLTRVPSGPADRNELVIGWHLRPAAGTRLELTFHAATPLLPGFLPLPGVGDEIADVLIGAASKALSSA